MIRTGMTIYMIRNIYKSDTTTILQRTTRTILRLKTITLVEFWQPNSEAINLEEIEKFQRQELHQTTYSLLEKAFLHVLVTEEGEPAYNPLSTNLGLNSKRRMLYFPMDCGELTVEGLIDTEAHCSAIPEADIRLIRLLAPQPIIKGGPVPSIQIMVTIRNHKEYRRIKV